MGSGAAEVVPEETVQGAEDCHTGRTKGLRTRDDRAHELAGRVFDGIEGHDNELGVEAAYLLHTGEAEVKLAVEEGAEGGESGLCRGPELDGEAELAGGIAMEDGIAPLEVDLDLDAFAPQNASNLTESDTSAFAVLGAIGDLDGMGRIIAGDLLEDHAGILFDLVSLNRLMTDECDLAGSRVYDDTVHAFDLTEASTGLFSGFRLHRLEA